MYSVLGLSPGLRGIQQDREDPGPKNSDRRQFAQVSAAPDITSQRNRAPSSPIDCYLAAGREVNYATNVNSFFNICVASTFSAHKNWHSCRRILDVTGRLDLSVDPHDLQTYSVLLTALMGDNCESNHESAFREYE